MDFAWMRKLLVTQSSLVMRQLDLKLDHFTKEDLLVMIIIQTILIGIIGVGVLICFCRKSGNTNENVKASTEKNKVSPINLKNISNNNQKDNANSKSTSNSTQGKGNPSIQSQVSNNISVKKDSDEDQDIKDVVSAIEERENSFTMRFREAEEKRLKHEKNVQKKEIKKQKKSGANASDDDDAGDWKVIKRGKAVETKVKA